MAKYSAGTREVAERHELLFVDMNRPLVDAIERLQKTDPKLARGMIPDRIHPGPQAGLLMAAHLLLAWNVPEGDLLVKVGAAEGEIAPIRVQRPLLLPYPLDIADPLTQKLVEQTPEMQLFANNALRAPGLPFGKARIEIDGQSFGEFSARELDRGIDLSAIDASLGQHAREIAKLVARRNELQFTQWRHVELAGSGKPLARNQSVEEELTSTEQRLSELGEKAAQPLPHEIEISGVGE